MRKSALQQNQPQPRASGITNSRLATNAKHSILNLRGPIVGKGWRLQQAEPGLEACSTATQMTRIGHDFSRIPVYPDTTMRIQPKKTVNGPGDIYEQEADLAADRVLKAPQRLTQHQIQHEKPTKDEHASRIPQSADRSLSPLQTMTSSEVPPIVHEALSSSGQPLDSSTREFFEPRFGHDFSRVRIHNDAKADAAARALNARAFTVGGDVVFASGEYRAEAASVRPLLAHELGHVVQQSGGSRPGEASPGLHPVGPSIQRSIRTMGGSWSTTKYELVQKEGDRDVTGAHIELNFDAEDPVDAELIGLTQIVRGIRKGSPRFIEESSKRRATPAGEKGVEAGAHIDQPETANPLYATGKTGEADTLASTPIALPGVAVTGEVRDLGQHGWHYHDSTGSLQHQEAILKDTPLFRDPAKNSTQTFETTALAIKGSQEGTYYGSVRWGWETDADGKLSQIPLAIVAAGVPSATFIRAAELWNAAKTSSGVATVDLPAPKLPAGAKVPSDRGTSSLVIEIARVNEELASMSPSTEKTNKEFEKKALEFALAKRPDKPTISLADQEKAAAALSTEKLVRRVTDLPEEIWKLRGEPWRGSTTDKELEWEAVHREIRKRKLFITVHVHETEDVFSDNVYVRAPSGPTKWWSSTVKLNNGDEQTFTAPLSSVFPNPSDQNRKLRIEAYDEDVEGDDLMFEKEWEWSDLPAAEKQSRDGGTYTVRVDFTQP